MEKITLSVTGMSCQGCADGLSRLFDKEPGIAKALVSFDESVAALEFDPAKVTKARLSKIVEAAGFSIQ